MAWVQFWKLERRLRSFTGLFLAHAARSIIEHLLNLFISELLIGVIFEKALVRRQQRNGVCGGCTWKNQYRRKQRTYFYGMLTLVRLSFGILCFLEIFFQHGIITNTLRYTLYDTQYSTIEALGQLRTLVLVPFTCHWLTFSFSNHCVNIRSLIGIKNKTAHVSPKSLKSSQYQYYVLYCTGMPMRCMCDLSLKDSGEGPVISTMVDDCCRSS